MDDLKVEPLSVSLGVHVIFEPQVILNVVDLDCASQVPALESRIEQEQVILLGHIDSVDMRWLTGKKGLRALRTTMMIGAAHGKRVVPLRRKFRQVLE